MDDDNDITRPPKKQKGQLSNYTVYWSLFKRSLNFYRKQTCEW